MASSSSIATSCVHSLLVPSSSSSPAHRLRLPITFGTTARRRHLRLSDKDKVLRVFSKATPASMAEERGRTAATAAAPAEAAQEAGNAPSMTLLFVEMGVGYDQHGQDITAAAMRACRDAISSNSIPAFRIGSIPGVSTEQMKLMIKLGVPRATQHSLDIERVKSIFPYGKIVSVEVVDGGMICSSGVTLEAMGDKNDDCYIVNAAVYVGY